MMSDRVEYRDSEFPEFQGNPLIEALPPLRSDREILGGLYRDVDHSEEERAKSHHYRSICVDRLGDLVIPQPEFLQLYRMLERMIWRGYETKNPFSPTTNYWLHNVGSVDAGVHPRTGKFKSNGCAATLLGDSGVGKTTLTKTVLEAFPQLIRHGEYEGRTLDLEQLVHLRVQSPSNASLSGLCRAIFGALDSEIGTSYRDEYGKQTVNAMLDTVDQLVRTHFIGLISIDELQSISVQKAGGKKAFLNFLLRLMDIAGVPFLLCGTPELEVILKEEQWTSRRCEEGGVIQLQRLNRQLWDIFLPQLWRYQWTEVATPITKDLSDQLYTITKGVLDYAVRSYQCGQKYVIGRSDERITEAVLREGFRVATQLSGTHIDAIHSETITATNGGSKAKDEQKNTKDAKEEACEKDTRIPDVDRVQHPEFDESIVSFLRRDTLVSDNASLVRDARNGNSALAALAESGLLITDPLDLSSPGKRGLESQG